MACRALDIYEPDGTRIAVSRVAFQPEPLPRLRDGLLAGVVTDELGVEYIARFEVR